jgi:hypothetical protein
MCALGEAEIVSEILGASEGRNCGFQRVISDAIQRKRLTRRIVVTKFRVRRLRPLGHLSALLHATFGLSDHQPVSEIRYGLSEILRETGSAISPILWRR